MELAQQPCLPLLHPLSRNCSPTPSYSSLPQFPPRTSPPSPLSNPRLHSVISRTLCVSSPPLSSPPKLRGSQFLRRSLHGSGGISLWRSISGRRRIQPQRDSRLVFVRLGGDSQDGEEPPETLFMRELKRRGMSPSTRSENKDYASSTETATLEGSSEGGADTGDDKLRSGGFTVKSAPLRTDERDSRNQRERSMALSSEALDGLIPRAQELLKLGGSFFLVFWPLILASLAAFIALYIPQILLILHFITLAKTQFELVVYKSAKALKTTLGRYLGATFIHAGNSSQVYRPPYVDPYKLLEEEGLPSELGPSIVPSVQ